MKERIIPFIICIGILGSMLEVSAKNIESADIKSKKVEESYLTMKEASFGTSSNSLTRGKHLMTGECSISKAGTNRIYTFGATTANHEVDFLAVIVYVDQYNEENDEWWQVDWFMEQDANDYFVYTSKSITVDRGYYYRVHADHLVQEGDDPIEETFSYTDGIWVGPPKTTE